MALTREVEVKSLTCPNATDISLVLTQILKEDGVEKSRVDISCYLDKTDSIPNKVTGIIAEMQTIVNNYKRAKNVLASTAFTNALNQIIAGVTL